MKRIHSVRVCVAFTFLLGSGVLLGCPTTGSTVRGQTTAQSASKMQDVKGETAPDFTLQDLKGRTHSLSQYKGKVVLLNFWATWCEPCKKEFPHFERFLKTYKPKGLSVLAVSIDDARAKSEVGPTIYRYGYTFTVLLDSEKRVVGLYNPKHHSPYSVLIDRKGQIRKRHQGYQAGDENALEQEIKKLLKE